jgi:hypothetical protein
MKSKSIWNARPPYGIGDVVKPRVVGYSVNHQSDGSAPMAVDNLPMDFGRDKPFYVYLYRDPRPGKKHQPFYVGKGTAKHRRADVHWTEHASNQILGRILQKLRDAGLAPEIEIIAWFDDESAALSCERTLIAKIGRRNLKEGPLANLTDGGDGPTRIVTTAELRSRRRAIMNQRYVDNEERQKQAARSKANWENHDYRERVISAVKQALSDPAQRTANSERFRALWEDAEYRAKQIENIRVVGARPEVKAARAGALKRRWADADQRAAMLKGGAAYTQTDEYKAEKSVETKSKWDDLAHREMRTERMRAAAAKPERRKQLIEMLAASRSDADAVSRRMRKAWETRGKWLWEVDGVVYRTAADAAAAAGLLQATFRWRAIRGRGCRRIPRGANETNNEAPENF